MNNDFFKFVICGTILFSLTAFTLNALASSVETVGELKTSGGIRFSDNSLQTSACSGCANGVLSILLGGTGGDTSSEARTNLGVPGLVTPNTFSADQTVAGMVNATSFSGSGSGLTSLNASSLSSGNVPDDRLPSNLARKYGKVAVVAVSGGDYTSPVTAMTAIASWCGNPSDSNTCLLRIMPGVYNLGSSPLTMQPYVDIEGSGETATVITGTVGSGSSSPANGLVNGANNAEIRFLTVRNTGGGDTVTAVRNSGASPRMTHMTADASGGNYSYGVYNYSSSPTMNNVIATASGGAVNYGVANSSSSPGMTGVTASASGGTTGNYGLFNGADSGAHTIKIDRSTFSGSTNSIRNDSEFTLWIGATNLTGGAVIAGGTFQCVGVYDGDTYTALNATCQ